MTELLQIKQKHLLVKNELKQLKTFDLSYFRFKSHFEEDGTQNYLIFHPMYKYFKTINSIDNISEWKSKELSNEIIKTSTTSDNFLNSLLRVKFSRSCLKQDKATHNHGTIVNIYIVYEISKNYNVSSSPTLKNCLFGAVSLNMLILISTNILDTVLDLIEKESFHLVVLDLVEM